MNRSPSANIEPGAGGIANDEIPIVGVTQDSVIGASLLRYQFAAQILKGLSVLDVGCAGGHGAMALIRGGVEHVTALDRSAEAIAYAKASFSDPGINYMIGSVEDLAPDCPYDAAVAFEVIEHCDDPDLLLAKLREVVRPEGVWFLSTPNAERRRFTSYRNPFHRFEWSIAEFRERLSAFFATIDLYGQGHIGPAFARRLRALSYSTAGKRLHRRFAGWLLRRLASCAGYREQRATHVYPVPSEDTCYGTFIPMTVVAVCRKPLSESLQAL